MHPSIFEEDLICIHQFENISLRTVRFVRIKKTFTPQFESIAESLLSNNQPIHTALDFVARYIWKKVQLRILISLVLNDVNILYVSWFTFKTLFWTLMYLFLIFSARACWYKLEGFGQMNHFLRRVLFVNFWVFIEKIHQFGSLYEV